MIYEKCKIKYRVIEGDKPGFGKFIAFKDLSFIFYLHDCFKNKKVLFGDKEMYSFFVERFLCKYKLPEAKLIAENFDDFVVVEPYIEDYNGKFLVNYKNFCVMSITSTGKFSIIEKHKPDEISFSMFYSDVYEFWFIEENGYYCLHKNSSTMNEDMKLFCFNSLSNGLFKHTKEYVQKQEEEKEKEDFELYLKLKNKFEGPLLANA